MFPAVASVGASSSNHFVPASNSTARGEWHDPLVRRLASRGRGDPEEIVERVAEAWLDEAGIDRFPVDVFGLASRLGVTVRRSQLEGYSGRIYVDHDKRVRMDVNASDGLERQRFTCAHELMHTAFPGFTREQRYRLDERLGDSLFARNRQEEEYLCDRGAAALLLPRRLLWPYKMRQGLRAVEKLASAAKVSLEVAANRLVSIADTAGVFIVLEQGHKPSELRQMRRGEDVESQLRVRYAVTRGVRIFVPRHTSVDQHSVFGRAQRSGRLEREVAPLPGSTRPAFLIEAKCFPHRDEGQRRQRVLALAWPASLTD
jgi:Zn-dependent peptidase ImmA (M78 family)